MKILIIFIMVNLIYSDCTTLSQYQCMVDTECQWIDDYKQGLCSDLNQSQCNSGDYGYCFWGDSYGGLEECQGGNYSISQGFCAENQNIVTNFIDNSIDDSIESLLINFGYQKLGDKNIYLINNRGGKEKIILSYDEINITYDGFELINPSFVYDWNSSYKEKHVYNYDKIIFHVSFDQIYSLITEFIYNKKINKISDLHIETYNFQYIGSNHRLDSKNIKPNNILKFSINKIELIFNGYINEAIIKNLDLNRELPAFNQNLKFKIQDFEVDEFIINNIDQKDEIVNLLSLQRHKQELFSINNLEFDMKYLPENNFYNTSVNFDHPYFKFDIIDNINIQNLETLDVEKIKIGNSNTELGALIKLPKNINIDLSQFIGKNINIVIPETIEGRFVIDGKYPGFLSSIIGIPTYFNYVEKAYASDAHTQIKTIYEECKIWRATHSDFPDDIYEMIEEDASNISNATLLKWQFEIDLIQSSESYSGIEGSIIATSTEEMPGGADKQVCFNVADGKYTGYGTSEECAEYFISGAKRFDYSKNSGKSNKNNEIMEEWVDINSLNFNFNFNLSGFSFSISDLKEPKIPIEFFNNLLLSNISLDFNYQNSLLNINSTIDSNLFDMSGNGLIDFKDYNNPWIDKGIIIISDISQQLESFIKILEEDIDHPFPRNFNDILLNITGYLEEPRIKGMEAVPW